VFEAILNLAELFEDRSSRPAIHDIGYEKYHRVWDAKLA
jgi:hypothetical protein